MKLGKYLIIPVMVILFCIPVCQGQDEGFRTESDLLGEKQAFISNVTTLAEKIKAITEKLKIPYIFDPCLAAILSATSF